MTIVVVKDGLMAADTMVVAYGANYLRTQKIFRFENIIVGFAGRLDQLHEVIKYLDKHSNLNDFKAVIKNYGNKLEALVLTKEGKVHSFANGKDVTTWNDDNAFAIGSGAAYALGAFAMGATAMQAVDAACKYDSGCGGGKMGLSFKEIPYAH